MYTRGLGQRLRPVLSGVLLVVFSGAAGAQQDGPRLPRVAPPAAPIYSKDGAVTVHAPANKAGYRGPVLIFVDRTREELQRTVRLKLGSANCPLEVAIGGKSDGDKRVLTARLRDGAGGVRERIELPDPEAAELAAFRRAVCVALLRAWMVDAGGTEATMRDLPVWLIDGVVRNMDRESRLADADRAQLLWSKACLPTAAELFAFDSLASRRWVRFWRGGFLRSVRRAARLRRCCAARRPARGGASAGRRSCWRARKTGRPSTRRWTSGSWRSGGR